MLFRKILMWFPKRDIIFGIGICASTLILSLILIAFDNKNYRKDDLGSLKASAMRVARKRSRHPPKLNMTAIAFSEFKEVTEKGTMYGKPVQTEKKLTYKPMCTIVLPNSQLLSTIRRVLYNPPRKDDIMTTMMRHLATKNVFKFDDTLEATDICEDLSKTCFHTNIEKKTDFVKNLMQKSEPRYTQIQQEFKDLTNYTKSNDLNWTMYINIIPHPVQWFAETYQRRRHGNMSLEDCVRKHNGSGCIPLRNRILTLTHFCDGEYICSLLRAFKAGIPTVMGKSSSMTMNRVASASLNHAVGIISSHYTVVGTSDNLEQFYLVLEKLMPQFFQGITVKFEQMKKDIPNNGMERLSKESRIKLEEILVYEMQLYHFVKERFTRVFNCVVNKPK